MNYAKKTGIVIVSYNAADAVKATLASVRRAHNTSPYKLILVDNASEFNEQGRIREIMQAHQQEMGSDWQYIEQPENLGFSGGNNIGISAFMADPEISDICLLNSDVIVTDHWLDRLLAYDKDIISSSTNRADGEQCIPVDYEADLKDFVAPDSILIPEAPYLRLKDFAERWYAEWKGNLVEADVTFFCVMLSRKVIDKLGLLDDTFFPGGFEDDDYCLRARDAGFSIYLARDVYIHHWGSASFGKLQYEYFSNSAQKNKAYLEQKHNITWQRRSEKPIVSYACDLEFALKNAPASPAKIAFLEMHKKNIARQINHFESEFNNLSHSLESCAEHAPEELKHKTEHARSYGDLADQWSEIIIEAAQALKTRKLDKAHAEKISAKLSHIANGIHERVDCNFAIHFYVTSIKAAADKTNQEDLPEPTSYAPAIDAGSNSRWARALTLARKGVEFIRKFDGLYSLAGTSIPSGRVMDTSNASRSSIDCFPTTGASMSSRKSYAAVESGSIARRPASSY